MPRKQVVRAVLAVVIALTFTATLAGCGLPRVDEELPAEKPWFEVETCDIEEGWVTVRGRLLESVPATHEAEPGIPEYYTIGLWPGPTASGLNEEFEVDEAGGFSFTYDFGEPRRGIYVLAVHKNSWGPQYVHVNLLDKEWSEQDDF